MLKDAKKEGKPSIGSRADGNCSEHLEDLNLGATGLDNTSQAGAMITI